MKNRTGKPLSLAARERLRRSYRPKRVKILFVGESPPVSGRFFYQADSGLFRAIRETFIQALPALKPALENKEHFLRVFQGMDCYLFDLCGRPVDRLSAKARREAWMKGQPRLTKTLRDLRPQIVVTVVRSVAGNVVRAQQKAEWSGLHVELPYPGRWHQHREEFAKGLVPLLRKNYSQDIVRRIMVGAESET